MKYIHIPLPVYSCLLSAALLSQAAAQSPTNSPAAPPAVPVAAVPAAPDAPPEAPPEAPPAVAVPTAPAVPAVPEIAAPPPTERAEKIQSFKFEQADLDLVMSQYCAWTGKIYLKNDAVKATISIKADKLTTKESIEVIEAILAMNDITLVPMGEKYIKVVPAQQSTGTGVPILYPDQDAAKSDKLVTKIFPLQNALTPEMEKAVRQMMHLYGQYLPLESSNCLMITDTEANITRIRELIEFLDQAAAAVEPRIYQIEYAEATEIAAKLNEIVAMAQEGKKTTTTVYGNPNARTPPGVVRARSSQSGGITKVSQSGGSGAPIIQGNVKVMPDERTNIILIFSQEDNFAFFDNIIKVLDIEVEPAISFEVVNLEYADAEELSGTLNELVGAAQSAQKSQGTSGSSRTSTASSRTSSARRVTPNAQSGALKSLARLSEDTKILADQRSNSILLMGRKADIESIKNVIDSLDVMLEQVVIEAAIFEIGLSDNLSHGISWLYQNSDQSKIGSWDGSSLTTNTLESVVSGAMNYYTTIPGLDSQMLINLSKTDGDARVISTPVIMTTDNTEATLSIGEQRPVVTSTSSYANSSGTQSSNYEYKDIGIQLTVTPRINPERMVLMELSQKADQIGEFVEIDNNQVPTILNREFEASIAVPDGETIVLGGLINTDYKDTVNKIPILGDIPFIGRYLFSSVQTSEVQRELIVLMTPYVITNDDEIKRQTERLYKGTELTAEDWAGNNWSESKLQLIPEEEQPEEAK